MLFDEYSSLFEIENVDDIEIGYIHIYTYKQAMDGYNNYKFNYNSNFKNELVNGLYTNVLIPNESSFNSSYFQKGYFCSGQAVLGFHVKLKGLSHFQST